MLSNHGVEEDLRVLWQKGDQTSQSSRNQYWISIGKTVAEAEAPILWPPDVKSWLIGKDSDAGKDWGQEEKGVSEDEMVGWHHWLNGHEFEQTLGDSEGQGSLACCRPWGHKESDITEWLNSNSTPEMHKSSAEEWLWMPNPQASVIRIISYILSMTR